MKARVERLEGKAMPSPPGPIDRIERIIVEPSPDGPRANGDVHVVHARSGLRTIEHWTD